MINKIIYNMGACSSFLESELNVYFNNEQVVVKIDERIIYDGDLEQIQTLKFSYNELKRLPCIFLDVNI